MQVVELEDWESVLQEFEGVRFMGADDGWLFRGMHDFDWPLQTSLERHTPPGLERSEAEDRLLNEFKRRAHIYLPQQAIPSANETGEWLALMQHFGAPTRLLDMTRSPYLALYFAIEDVSKVSSSAIWAVNRHWCLSAAGHIAFNADPREAERWFEPVKAMAIESKADDLRREILIREIPKMKGEEIARRDAQWRQREMTSVVPFVPDKLTQRLSIQQGEFLVPLNLDVSFVENLAALGDPVDGLVKFRVPYTQRARILERLRLMNITREQLFPGLDGFAQSFQQFLFKEPSDDRMNRQMWHWFQNHKQDEEPPT